MEIGRKGKRVAAGLGVLMMAGGLLAGCGTGGTANNSSSGSTNNTSSGSSSSGSTKNIVFLAHVTPNLTMNFWQSEVKIFEEKNPNIHVKVISDPSTNVDQYAKTLLASGQFPDVQYNLDVSSYVKDGVLRPFAIDSQVKQIKHYKAQLYNGKLYDLGPVLQPQNLIFYNKKLFAKAGISGPPKTAQQFDEDCKKLKAAGITPMLTSGDWATNQIFTDYLTGLIANDPTWLRQRRQGKVHFTDPNVIADVTRYSNAVKDGYFNKGAMSVQYPQLEKLFVTDQAAAMYPMGIWFTASSVLAKSPIKNDIGVFVMPTKDGKIHLTATIDMPGFTVYSKTKHPNASVKLAEFFAFDPNVQKTLLKADGLISDLKNPVTYKMNPLQQQVFNLVQKADTTTGTIDLNFGDNAPIAGTQTEVDKIAQQIFQGESPLQAMKSLDQWWNQQSSS